MVVALGAPPLAGAGAFLIVFLPRHDQVLAVAVGAWTILIGVALGLWAWRGNWEPPDRLGEYFTNHRFWVQLAVAGLSIDLLLRTRRWHRAKRSAASTEEAKA